MLDIGFQRMQHFVLWKDKVQRETSSLLKGQEMTTAMPAPRLPDPVHDVDFYRDVPVKRLIAWVIDAGMRMLRSSASRSRMWAACEAKPWLQLADAPMCSHSVPVCSAM